MKGDPRTLAAAAAAAVLTKERHGAAGVERGAAFVPFLFSGEAVAVEDPLQGGFHHPAAGVRNQQNLRSTLRAAFICGIEIFENDFIVYAINFDTLIWIYIYHIRKKI